MLRWPAEADAVAPRHLLRPASFNTGLGSGRVD